MMVSVAHLTIEFFSQAEDGNFATGGNKGGLCTVLGRRSYYELDQVVLEDHLPGVVISAR